MISLKPELRAAAVRHDALGLADGLERLIDEERATAQDREAAYEAVRQWRKKTAEYAFARAALAGRLAEIKGLSAIGLIAEMEKWARMSVALNPRFRDGAGRRMLGSLYVLAPASLVRYGDSEDGLELLEKQVERFPDNPVNHLRLAEGYIALDDHEGAFEPLCLCITRSEQLRPSEQHLLKTLIGVVGGEDTLACDE